LHRFYHILHILICHTWVKGQGDHTLIIPIGYGEVVWLVIILVTIVRVQVDGDEVDAGANVEGLKLFDELGSVDLKLF
jgi:hypothetical protein